MIEKLKKQEKTIAQIINSKNRPERYMNLFLGLLLLSLAFNLFFSPRNIVYGGVSGTSIIIRELFGTDPAVFIFFASIFLLLMSLIFLGKEKTARTVVGSILFPIFVKLTENFSRLVDLSGLDIFLVVLFGALTAGFGAGLVFKAGFTTGGTDILNQIVSKYFKVSIGKAMLMTDGLIVLAGGFLFGIEMVLYAIIVLYIISVMTDKVMLGMSQSKAFYIMTSKEEKIKEYILDNLSHGVTVLEARGGYTNDEIKVLMCIIPTKEYFSFKEGIEIIDKNAFFIVTDAYEVGGKHK